VNTKGFIFLLQSNANKTKEFIIRDIEGKIIELHKRKENRIKKVENIIAAGKTSIEDIRQRMYKTQVEIKEHKEVSYDILPDNDEKVCCFKFNCLETIIY